MSRSAAIWKNIGLLLLGGWLAAFVVAAVLTRLYLCNPVGPLAFTASFFLGVAAGACFLLVALRTRSWGSAAGGAALVGIASVLDYVSVGFAVPSCLGI